VSTTDLFEWVNQPCKRLVGGVAPTHQPSYTYAVVYLLLAVLISSAASESAS
jgi:hypothetical protein